MGAGGVVRGLMCQNSHHTLDTYIKPHHGKAVMCINKLIDHFIFVDTGECCHEDNWWKSLMKIMSPCILVEVMKITSLCILVEVMKVFVCFRVQ